MKRPNNLKPRFQLTLDFIIAYKRREFGIAPSMEEIMKHVGVPSKSNMSYILRRLEELGEIKLTRGKNGGLIARGIHVPGSVWLTQEEHQKLLNPKPTRRPHRKSPVSGAEFRLH